MKNPCTAILHFLWSNMKPQFAYQSKSHKGLDAHIVGRNGSSGGCMLFAHGLLAVTQVMPWTLRALRVSHTHLSHFRPSSESWFDHENIFASKYKIQCLRKQRLYCQWETMSTHPSWRQPVCSHLCHHFYPIFCVLHWDYKKVSRNFNTFDTHVWPRWIIDERIQSVCRLIESPHCICLSGRREGNIVMLILFS